MEELVDDLKTAGKEIASAAAEAAASPNTPEDGATETREETINRMRSDLLQLSEDGAISQSVACIRKASAKALEKFQAQYKRCAQATSMRLSLISLQSLKMRSVGSKRAPHPKNWRI